jgi:hypothetical protein
MYYIILSVLATRTETFASLLFQELSCVLYNSSFIWMTGNTNYINSKVLVLHFSWRVTIRHLYSLRSAAILVLHLEKEHEEGHWLTYHLWTKMKYLVLKRKVRKLTMERYSAAGRWLYLKRNHEVKTIILTSNDFLYQWKFLETNP